MVLRASVVIDYQNVHLTARDVFAPNTNKHECLIHPMQFARRAIAERNARQRAGHPHAELAAVSVYRGLHHVDYDWEQNRRCLDQATQWRNDGARVELRDLKYKYQYGANGQPVLDINGKKVPVGRPEEKGIDVLCALACLREAQRPDIDLVIFAAIETVAWFNPRWREEGTRSYGKFAADCAPAHLEHQPRPCLLRGFN